MTDAIVCVFCSGKGQRKDPLDRDCYEGLKMAQIITCSSCEGMGKIDADTKLGQQLLAAQEAGEDWETRQTLISGALRKLSIRERNALGL